jgi:hypothetical protein
MQNPKAENVKKIIDLFKSVLPRATKADHLNMAEASVNGVYKDQVTKKEFLHVCGTVHCHGGWMAVAAKLYVKEKKLFGFITYTREEIISYMAGVEYMAKILFGELSVPDVVQKWAARNPMLWGNDNGNRMFDSSYAFISEKRPFGAKTLQHIIDHWTEVYDRLVILEKPIEISEPPITVEDLIGVRKKELIYENISN